MERPDLYNEKCCDYPEIKITVKPAGKIIIPENLADSFAIIQNICDDIFEIVPEYYYDKEPFKSFLALSKDIDSLLEKRYIIILGIHFGLKKNRKMRRYSKISPPSQTTIV